MKSIKETLRTIGLTRGEVDVYVALLELGRSTTGNITKEAIISSSKVYEVLQRLVLKGLVSFVVENGRKQYEATPPERLVDFLEEKKEELCKGQEAIKAILPKIKRKQKTTSEAVIYRGKQGPLIALNELFDIMLTGEESVGFGTNNDDYDVHYPAQLRAFIEESSNHKLRTRLLFGEGYMPPNYTADVRHLPQEYISPVRTMIAGSKVFIVDFTEPMTTIVIDKKEIAQGYMSHFNLLWSVADRKTRVYSGKEGAARVLKEIIAAGRKGFPNFGFGTHDNPYTKYLREEMQEFFLAEKKYKIETKLLFMEGGEHKQPNAHVRYLPKEFLSPLRIMIYGDSVAMVDFTDPWTTIIIDKKEIAQAFEKQFHFLWKIAGASKKTI